MKNASTVTTITELRENATKVIAKYNALVNNIEQTIEQLSEPVDYKTGLDIAAGLGGPKAVRYAQERLFPSACMHNSEILQVTLNLVDKGSTYRGIFDGGDQFLVDAKEFIKVTVRDALESVSNDDVDTYNELRKDVYRLVSISRSAPYFHGRDNITFADLEPADYEDGGFLLDNDLLGTAGAALDTMAKWSSYSYVDVDQFKRCVGEWEMLSSVLIEAAERFLKYKTENK